VRRYILDEATEVRIGRWPMTVEVVGGPDVSLTAEVAGSADGLAPRRGARPDRITLPDVAATTRLRVTPHAGGDFPEGTVVTLELRTQPRDGGAEETVTVRAVDVSGRPARDLAVLLPVDERTLVVRRVVDLDVPLGPLAAQARTVARSLLDVDGRDEPLDVVVAVDMSASMAPATADGLVEAAIEAVVGVAQVLAPRRTPSVFLVGAQTTGVSATAPREVSAAASAAIRVAGRGAGFRATPRLPAGRRTIVYVVTDEVPADVDELTAAGGTDWLRRLVLVDPAGRPQRPPGVPVAVVPAPPDGVSVRDHLQSSAPAMAELVAPMVAGFERAGGRR
jgi:hypothetical protein